MSKSRSEKAIINTFASLGNEVVSVACGLILPRLILSAFGSSYNGIVTSISQFISCISLMRAGISGVTRAALYKPLAEKNDKEISSIVIATEQFLRKVALIFAVGMVGFAALYPIFVVKEFDWLFSFTLVLILSISTFVQYFFGLTYQMLLIADQKQKVVSYFRIISIVSNTVFAAILIKCGAGIHLVKLGSAVAFAITPIATALYVKKHYNIDHKVAPNSTAISQRWDALGHEIAHFINSNTDVIVLTLFLGVKTVSVYSVYNHVIVSIKKVVTNSTISFGAAFGDMYAKKQYDLMYDNLGIFEIIVFSTASIVYSVTIAMIRPFALIYTHGVNDISYDRPIFGIIISLAGLFACYRIPYYVITTSVGHYKQTRNGAFVEAALNIVISVVFVIKFGIVGVAVGTLVAALFRSCVYAVYLSRHILKRSIMPYITHVIVSLAICLIIYVIGYVIPIDDKTIVGWIIKAIALTGISVVLVLISNYAIWKKETKLFIAKVGNNVKTKIRKKR